MDHDPKDRHMRPTRQLFLILAAATLLTVMGGCGNATDNDQLVTVDTLLAHSKAEEALQMLQAINTTSLNHHDKAYHALLSTQAAHAYRLPAKNDSAINGAVKYFESHNDKEKHARALLYQGQVYADLGKLEEAFASLRLAEDVADSNDLKNRAMAKMMMGELYQSQVIGAKTLGASKYREALALFNLLEDKHHQIICMSELGGLYRINTEKQDSALYYINEAIDLAKMENEPQYVVANLFSRAEYNASRGDYQNAKNDAVKAIEWNGGAKIHPRVHYTAASAYLHLGRTDSAMYYLNHSPAKISAADSIMYYQLMADIALHDRRMDEAVTYQNITHVLADSVAMSGMNDRLLEVEKKYDTQQAALQNALLNLRLRGTLLVLTLLALVAGGLAFLVWRYRNRLKIQQTEYELQKADLDQSITSLQQMQRLLDERESTKNQSQELKAIVDNQIQVVHQLLQWSYECNETTFAKRFNSLMTMRGPDEVGASYWDNLQSLANELYDNVLVKAQEAADGTLRDDEINLIALQCHGFSRTVIMICMRYRNLRTVSNKRIQIAHKLHVNTLDEFLQPFLKKESEIAE